MTSLNRHGITNLMVVHALSVFLAVIIIFSLL